MNFLGGLPQHALRDLQIPTSYHDKKTRDAFAFVRFVCADATELLLITDLYQPMHFKVEDLEPLSLRNETHVLQMLQLTARGILANFDTSLEEDTTLLQDPTLTSNQRNCVVVRRGEKQVLQHYIDLADVCIPLLAQPWSVLRRKAAQHTAHGSGRFDAYIALVVAPLVQAQNP